MKFLNGSDRYPALQHHSGASPRRIGLSFSIICLIFALILSSNVIPVQAATLSGLSSLPREAASNPLSRLGPRLQARLAAQPAAGKLLPVVLTLSGTLDLQPVVPAGSAQERQIRTLQAQAERTQAGLLRDLQAPLFAGQVADITPFWIIDALTLRAAPGAILALAARPEVAQVELEASITPVSVTTQATTGAWDNLGKVNAPALWAAGFRGQGVVVASLDTGVDASHPELQASWRGGTNSWYDPYGKHTTPVDLPASCTSSKGAPSGHGTETMGVMVGKTVGVAPGAQWIAAKIFDDNCQATTTAVLSAFQWLLDPDGNPATADAPQVVVGAWEGSGCDLTYLTAVQNLRAAGILPVFSAGNYGPGTDSGAFPAVYADSFPVGATDFWDAVPSFSSRGPDSCDTHTPFPELVAPGVSIRTTTPGGGYTAASGTSLSAPHVAGALALLLSAHPGLTVQQQEDALINSAVDLGTPGPDDVSGYGRLDIQAALQWLAPDAHLGFALPGLSVNEDTGAVSVTVTRSGGTSFSVAVDLSVVAGTAVAGTNYAPLAATHLVFAPKETQKTVQITLLQDNRPTPNKVLQLGLSNPLVTSPGYIQPASVNTITSQMTLTIVNVDPWVTMLPMIVH